MPTSSTIRTHPARPAPAVHARRPAAAWLLVTAELFVVINAVLGGVQLIRTGYGIPLAWLAGTPFPDWTWPGILLIASVAGPHALAASAVLVPTRWSPRIGWVAGYLAGASLIVWIVVQLAVLQHYFFLQPVIAGVGLLEIGLSAAWRHGHRQASPTLPAY